MFHRAIILVHLVSSISIPTGPSSVYGIDALNTAGAELNKIIKHSAESTSEALLFIIKKLPIFSFSKSRKTVKNPSNQKNEEFLLKHENELKKFQNLIHEQQKLLKNQQEQLKKQQDQLLQQKEQKLEVTPEKFKEK